MMDEHNFSNDLYTGTELDELDMTSESLDFEPPILHANGFSYGKTKDSKAEIAAEGINIRSGKWTKRETKILTRNLNRFKKKFNIPNLAVLFGINLGNQKEVRQFVKAKQMYVRIGKHLNDRTLYNIYLQARKLLQSQEKRHFSENELETLRSMFLKHGNNWKKISLLTDRSALNCREAWRWNYGGTKRGHWTADEDKEFIKVLTEKFGPDFKSKICSSSWEEIAKLFPSRNYFQCRLHWLQKLCREPEKIERWSKKASACLIYWMYTNLSEIEVNWDDLFEVFRSCSSSYVTVQRKWSKLKTKVPFFKEKEHEDIVLYLYNKHLPQLLLNLKLNISDLEEIIESGSFH